MKELDLSIDILNEIYDDSIDFAEALKNKFQKEEILRPFRKEVAGLVGCALRHELLFRTLLKDKGLDEKETRIALLYLANAVFYKHFSNEVFRKPVCEYLGEDKVASMDEIIAKGADNLIPENLKPGSLAYLSLRYNTPEWVLNTWKRFGYGNVYKMARKMIRQDQTFVRVRTSVIDEEIVNGMAGFKASPISHIFSYEGKEPLRKIKEYAEGKMFDERPGYKSVLDQFHMSEPSEIFLYYGSHNDMLAKEIIETYGAGLGLNIGVSDSLDKHVSVTKLIKAKGLHNVNFFYCEPSMIEVSISRPQELVVVYPESTDFDFIRSSPDFYLHHGNNKMDELLSKQKEALENAANFVAENGRLVYMVSTLSMKESSGIVSNFIQTHSGFELEKEEQLYGFDALNTTLYYAVIKNNPELAKLGTPLNELTTSPEAATMSQLRFNNK